MLRFFAVVLVMCYTIRRMIEGTRPIDWLMLVIELLVLLLIAAETIVQLWNWVNKKRIVKKLQALFARGDELEHKAPAANIPESDCDKWIEGIVRWIGDTENYLKESCSAPAAISFTLDTTDFSGVHYRYVASYAHSAYLTLKMRLANLNSIIRSLDSYL